MQCEDITVEFLDAIQILIFTNLMTLMCCNP